MGQAVLHQRDSHAVALDLLLDLFQVAPRLLHLREHRIAVLLEGLQPWVLVAAARTDELAYSRILRIGMPVLRTLVRNTNQPTSRSL